jgi:hypothetical protein
VGAAGCDCSELLNAVRYEKDKTIRMPSRVRSQFVVFIAGVTDSLAFVSEPLKGFIGLSDVHRKSLPMAAGEKSQIHQFSCWSAVGNILINNYIFILIV